MGSCVRHGLCQSIDLLILFNTAMGGNPAQSKVDVRHFSKISRVGVTPPWRAVWRPHTKKGSPAEQAVKLPLGTSQWYGRPRRRLAATRGMIQVVSEGDSSTLKLLVYNDVCLGICHNEGQLWLPSLTDVCFGSRHPNETALASLHPLPVKHNRRYAQAYVINRGIASASLQPLRMKQSGWCGKIFIKALWAGAIFGPIWRVLWLLLLKRPLDEALCFVDLPGWFTGAQVLLDLKSINQSISISLPLSLAWKLPEIFVL